MLTLTPYRIVPQAIVNSPLYQTKAKPLSSNLASQAHHATTFSSIEPLSKILLGLFLLALPALGLSQNTPLEPPLPQQEVPLPTPNQLKEQQQKFDHSTPTQQRNLLFNQIIDNPCGCEDEEGNAPPTLRFTPQQLHDALELDPNTLELLPDEMLNSPEPGTEYLFNPHHLDLKTLKELFLEDGEELTPIENSSYFKIIPTQNFNKNLIIS